MNCWLYEEDENRMRETREREGRKRVMRCGFSPRQKVFVCFDYDHDARDTR